MEIMSLKMEPKIASEGKFIGSVYALVNTVNCKVYIGKTVYSCEKRWLEHKYHINQKRTRGYPLYKALRKYGWEAFEKIVIYQSEEFDSVELVNEIICHKEQFYIDLFRSDNHDFGYNVTKGGEGIVGYRHTEEAKKLMSETRSGSQHWNYGNRNKSSRCRPVVQLDLDFNFIAEYPSLAELSRHYDRKQDGGIEIKDNHTFQNTIIIDKENYTLEYLQQHYNNVKRASNDKEIMQFDLEGNFITSYISVAEAGRKLNCDPSGIGYSALGKTITCKNYLWIYTKDYSDQALQNKIKRFKESSAYKSYMKYGYVPTAGPKKKKHTTRKNKKLNETLSN